MGRLNQILILFAHPALEKSRVNRRLLRAVQGLDAVYVHDLYEVYPDFQIDIKAEQDLLLAHDIIVFQHPFYWYSSPALLKEWQDLVLEYGFAYGQTGVALQGKKVLTTITTGGGEQAYCRAGYNRFTIRELLAPFEQTANLCGMDYLPPFVIHGAHAFNEPHEIETHAENYRRAIIALRDDLMNWEQLAQIKYINQHLDQVIQPSEVTTHAK